MGEERVSIVIATRDRPKQIEGLLASLAALTSSAHEIVLVDQSSQGETARVVEEYARIGISYVHQNARGLSRARNLGVAHVTGEIVGFTDDDCEVAPDFARAIAEAFRRTPEAAVLFGQVVPGAHDETRGLVPNCVRSDERVARVPTDLRFLGGMGACMAIRRDSLLRLGGFDVYLGAGAIFRAAEERDLAMRALVSGAAVVETPWVRVTHHGFRTWRELELLADGYLLGSGAMFAKHARLWPLQTARLLASAFRRWAVGRPRINYLREARRRARLLAFARGGYLGIHMDLDRRRQLFKDPQTRSHDLAF